MIRADGLTKQFGATVAVDHLSVDIAEGEVFGILGPNGAGKTTTVRMLAGLISKTSGTAVVAGCEIGKEADELRLRRQIGVLPENVGLYEGSTALQNLEYFGQLYRVEPTALRANIERLLRRMELWDKRDVPVETYSKGMKQKLAIARALVHDPVLLFLDEPTANLDPEAAKMVRETLLSLREEKHTIVLNTHNLDEAQRVCDRVAILRTRLITVGSPHELRSRSVAQRTVVRLDHPTEALAAAVRERLGGRPVEIVGQELRVAVQDPERENPEIIAALVSAGARIQEITQAADSLEDVYLRLIHESEGRA
jgi:ABC-2 type transport system ATP-binding protein